MLGSTVLGRSGAGVDGAGVGRCWGRAVQWPLFHKSLCGAFIDVIGDEIFVKGQRVRGQRVETVLRGKGALKSRGAYRFGVVIGDVLLLDSNG